MKIIVFLFFLSFQISLSIAQKPDNHLQKQVVALLQGFNGDIGVYVHDLKKNRFIAINADSIFPTASMVKLPILTGIMQKIDSKELDYHQPMVYNDSLLYEGEDILGSFKNNEKIELSKVIMLMLTTSDNTASLWLQSLAGGGERVNEILNGLGLTATRVNSRTPGRNENRQKYGWGQSTPREMVSLVEKIVAKEVINMAASEKMLRLMSRNYWDEEAISSIPTDVFIAGKTGAVNTSRSEVLFVNGKKCRYLFCICTKNNKDTSWEKNNEAWVLTRKLSALLWDYYH
jgi:beta-lactamase class A